MYAMLRRHESHGHGHGHRVAGCAWLALLPSQEKQGSQRYEKGVISFRNGQYPWTGNTHGGQYRWTHCM
eukprot:scaffold2137_cov140-Skeletonema_menzelii.AAC.13